MLPRIEPFSPLTPAARAQSLAETISGHTGTLWIFAYGSLLWNPDFPVAEARRATLHGYRRSFCVWSVLARGTPENPGLGLGVVADEAARCEGVALRIDAVNRDAALERIWEREMWTDVYQPIWRQLTVTGGQVTALVFHTDMSSRQYAADLTVAQAARLIADAKGKFGSCRDYLEETIAALRENGMSCPELTALHEEVERYAANE